MIRWIRVEIRSDKSTATCALLERAGFRPKVKFTVPIFRLTRRAGDCTSTDDMERIE